MGVKPDRRLWVALALLILGLAAVGSRLWYLQVHARAATLAASYLDGRTLSLMNRLLHQGVLRRLPDGRLAVNHDRLVRQVPGFTMRRRVVSYAARAWLPPGRQELDYRLFRVWSPGQLTRLRGVLRGRILDRRGRPLAVSRLYPGSRLPYRYYTLGPSASQPLGFFSPVFGSRGLEAALAPILLAPDPAKRPLRNAGRLPLRLGCDAILTLDARMQVLADTALEGKRGAVVILDAKSGAVLAAAGKPAFDPNQSDPFAWRKARGNDRGRLLRARAWERLYPPGSTFKLLVAAAWLESGRPAPVMVVPQYDSHLDIGDIVPHGRVDLERALIRSCNVYFARLGLRLGSKVAALAQRAGFNRPGDLLPQLPKLHLPVAASLAYARWKYSPGPEGHRDRRLVNFTTYRRDFKVAAQGAIGQNMVSVTPLKMASLVQAIANHGLMRPPYILAGYRDPERSGRYRSLPLASGRRLLQPANANHLAATMARVMVEGTGRTAPRLRKDGKPILVAGKTGTAETGREGERPHSWFVGFAPAEAPRYVLAVVVENGGRGSRTAAPLGVRLLGQVLEAEILEREQRTARRKVTP